MNPLVRRPAAAAAICLMLGASTGCGLLGVGDAPAPIIIGVDLAGSGGDAQTAADAIHDQALQLRLEQINRIRAEEGEPLLQLEILDNRSDPQTALTNLTELVGNPDVAAVITGACAECTVQAAQVLTNAEVPTISLAAGVQVAQPVEERRWIFQIAPDPAVAADLLAAEVGNPPGDEVYDTVAVLATDDMYGVDFAEELPDALAIVDIDAPLQLTINRTDEDTAAGLAQQVVSWRAEPPPPDAFGTVEDPEGVDAVVLAAPPRAADQMAVALHRAGWDGPLWLDTICAGRVFASGELAEALANARMLAPSTMVGDQLVAALPGQAARKAWYNAYTAEHFEYHNAAGYAADALGLIDDALRRAGQDPDVLRDTIEVSYLAGATGEVRFAPSNHIAFVPQTLLLMQFDTDRWRP